MPLLVANGGNMEFLLGLGAGIWLGASIGVFAASLLRMSKYNDCDTRNDEPGVPGPRKAADSGTLEQLCKVPVTTP